MEQSPELQEEFKELHRGLYGLYQLPLDRDQIHDHLSDRYAGPALTEAYVEHYVARSQMLADEVAVDVREVDYERLRWREDRSGWLEVDWSVGGIVTHGDHKHTRANRYQASFLLHRGEQGLRILDTQLQEMRRLPSFLAEQQGWILDDIPQSSQGYLDLSDLLSSGALEELAAPADAETP